MIMTLLEVLKRKNAQALEQRQPEITARLAWPRCHSDFHGASINRAAVKQI
jgi:hypothetical protein